MMNRWKWAAVVALTLAPQWAWADLSVSPHLHIYEYEFGGGGLVNESSASYSAGENIGDAGVGKSSSANYGVQAGFDTTADPTLSLQVLDDSPSFGDFSPAQPSTATSRFVVSNYTSYGYAVQVVGDPPTNGSHSIAPITSPDPSQVGQEQYGINLVANASPVSFGADPDNGLTGLGLVAPGYDTPDYYQYNSGDTVAYATKTSGQTTYTISYLVNVSSITPGGQYQTSESIICVGFY